MVATIFEYSYTLITFFLLWFFLRMFLEKKYTGQKAFFHWILFGFLFNLYSLSWLYTIYPLPWMSKGVTQVLSIAGVHILTSLVASLSCACVGLLYVLKTESRVLRALVFSALLSLSEILRSLFISTLFYKEGGTIDLHWGAGSIGNALSTTPLVEYAYFGGVYMLTAIVGFIVFSFSSRKNIQHLYKDLLGIGVLLVIIHVTIPVTAPQKEITVGVITTNFENPKSGEELLSFKKNNEVVHLLTLSLASSSPSILVYPEDTRYTDSLTPLKNTELLAAFQDVLLIDGGTMTIPHGGLSNVSLFYRPTEKKRVGRGKEFLFPFNEYLPVIFSGALTKLFSQEELAAFETYHTYTPLHTHKTISFYGTKIGTLICSEILSFATIQHLKKEKPSLVFFQSRFNVFHNNPLFIMHLRSFSKVAAAQLRTPLISSSNNAPSLLLSPYGDIEEAVPTGFSADVYRIRSDGHIIKK